ncbi:MAG: PAS domain-containing protein [Opitutales bacterium]|nr:PAS domain-containing protein [Opitutales bacterium]
MAYVIISVLAVLVLFLWRRQAATARAAAELAAAARRRAPFLAEEGGALSRPAGMEELTTMVNSLVEENRRLREAEQDHVARIKATLGSLREAVLIINNENAVLVANEALRQLLGLTEPPLGKRIETFLQSSALVEYIRNTRAGGAAEHTEMEFTAGGKALWFEVTGARLNTRREAEEGLVLLIMHDITRQKRLERVRTEFVANVSHELRTPVTVIKGFVETLLEDRAELDEKDQVRFLTTIQKNVCRLHQLLEELLLLSRLESSESILKKETVALGDVLREVAESYAGRAKECGCEVIVEEGAEPARIDGDPLRLSQVLENLVENAFKHARGFSRLRLHVDRIGAEVVCGVEDDGAGIPAADLARVFERFYRVEKGRSRESGGTGLGLAIVKHIVQLHGGRVDVASTPGKGTHFRCYFPAAE